MHRAGKELRGARRLAASYRYRRRRCLARAGRPGPARAGRLKPEWARTARRARECRAQRAPPRPGPRARPRGPAGDPAPRFREGEEARGRTAP